MTAADSVTGTQHIGVPTDDMQKTVSFYNSLGFTTILETQNPDSKENVAFLQLKNLVIETWETPNAAKKIGAIDHIALDVKEIDALFARLQSAGYELLDSAVQFLPFWEHGVRFFTILGPNQEKLEFCERLRS